MGPPIGALALVLTVVELIVRKTTWLASLESPLTRRLASLDGLRAFLALGVVVCHIGTFYDVYRGMPWGPHPNPYYRQAGAASVRLFFMITGFLFWSKAIRGAGRLEPLSLYRNRLYRIMPLYAALVATLIAFALIGSSFRLVEPLGRILREVGGLVVPGFQTEGKINGLEYTGFVRPVWTLKWEVVFYAMLPFIASGARSLTAFAFLAVGLVLATTVGHRFVPDLDLSITLNFLVGMLVAHLKAKWTPPFDPKGRLASAFVVAVLALAPLVIASVSPYLGNLLYAATFALIVYGNDLFGLLSLRSSRVIGEVSYSVYLLHMVVLVLFYGALDRTTMISRMSFEAFWLVSTLPIAVIILLSFLTFRYVERWGIDRAHRKAAPAS